MLRCRSVSVRIQGSCIRGPEGLLEPLRTYRLQGGACRRVIEDMTVRNLSPATQRSYISGVVKFSRHFGLSPERLGLEDVRAFQVHLVSTGISWASLNQIVCALRFFYGVTLGQETIPERIPYAREPHKLPVVLSADEVVRFLEAVARLRSRAGTQGQPHPCEIRTSPICEDCQDSGRLRLKTAQDTFGLSRRPKTGIQGPPTGLY